MSKQKELRGSITDVTLVCNLSRELRKLQTLVKMKENLKAAEVLHVKNIITPEDTDEFVPLSFGSDSAKKQLKFARSELNKEIELVHKNILYKFDYDVTKKKSQ